MALEDMIKVRLYAEFHAQNKKLFETSPQEYSNECMRYVERRYTEEKYKYIEKKPVVVNNPK